MLLTEIRQEVPQVPAIDTDASIAMQASRVLNYDQLKWKLSDEERKSNRLLQILADLQIAALSTEDVHAYKKEKAQSINAADFATWNAEIDGNENCELHFTPSHMWRKTTINHYKADIPTFVLNKLIQIVTAEPATRVWIEYIAERDPIVAVELDEAYIYIDAWDETALENKIIDAA